MPGFMHLPEMTSLALHAMAYIAALESGTANVKEIAAATGASAAHLAKVMQRLVHAGLASSNRGPAGGFSLAAAARDITLLDIYRVFEGGDSAGDCPVGRSICPFNDCLFGGILTRMEDEFRAHLSGRTLAEYAGALKRKGPAHPAANPQPFPGRR